MHDNHLMLKQVRRALEHEPRIHLHQYPIRIEITGGAVVLEGEAPDIAAKKLALERVGAIDGVRGVVDRLHVVPAARRGDGAIQDSLGEFLLREPELRNCTVRVRAKGRIESLREVTASQGIMLESTSERIVRTGANGPVGWLQPTAT